MCGSCVSNNLCTHFLLLFSVVRLTYSGGEMGQFLLRSFRILFSFSSVDTSMGYSYWYVCRHFGLTVWVCTSVCVRWHFCCWWQYFFPRLLSLKLHCCALCCYDSPSSITRHTHGSGIRIKFLKYEYGYGALKQKMCALQHAKWNKWIRFPFISYDLVSGFIWQRWIFLPDLLS